MKCNKCGLENAENAKKRQEDKFIEKNLREGNREAVVKFLQDLLQGAKSAYDTAKSNRESAFESFMADQRLSQVEEKKLRELEEKEKEANARLQDYQNRLADAQDSVEQIRSSSLGSFSFDVLKGMFGQDSAAERTADAAEEQVRNQKNTNKYMKSMLELLDLSYD